MGYDALAWLGLNWLGYSAFVASEQDKFEKSKKESLLTVGEAPIRAWLSGMQPDVHVPTDSIESVIQFGNSLAAIETKSMLFKFPKSASEFCQQGSIAKSEETARKYISDFIVAFEDLIKDSDLPEDIKLRFYNSIYKIPNEKNTHLAFAQLFTGFSLAMFCITNQYAYLGGLIQAAVISFMVDDYYHFFNSKEICSNPETCSSWFINIDAIIKDTTGIKLRV